MSDDSALDRILAAAYDEPDESILDQIESRTGVRARVCSMNLLKALATVSGMTLLSRILGFVRDMVIARGFGAEQSHRFVNAVLRRTLRERHSRSGTFSSTRPRGRNFSAPSARSSRISSRSFAVYRLEDPMLRGS